MKVYIVKYNVDSGCNYTLDSALVFAENVDDAKNKIKKYISNLGNEYMITDIFYIKEFDGEVFTKEHGTGYKF